MLGKKTRTVKKKKEEFVIQTNVLDYCDINQWTKVVKSEILIKSDYSLMQKVWKKSRFLRNYSFLLCYFCRKNIYFIWTEHMCSVQICVPPMPVSIPSVPQIKKKKTASMQNLISWFLRFWVFHLWFRSLALRV